MVAEILRMENICKEYAGREEALHNACISIRCGEKPLSQKLPAEFCMLTAA